MGQALYRKYRSHTLDEVVGQSHITSALKNALQDGQISHAYLFTGPRGVGKTSIARILAHEINKLPYDGENMHLDIIEIDAASNRGIEEIRDLRDKVRLAPTSAKFKVYIIDEVHMLTTHAFNALLKTLEEPPAHVVFILATTELQKLPETIISRTQRFGFRPISADDMLPHLRMIADKESIAIDDAALMLIASHANGGFRDAISLLDQCRAIGGKIDASAVESAIGLPPQSEIAGIIQAIVDNDASLAVDTITGLFDNGYNPGNIASQILNIGRQYLMQNGGNTTLLDFMDSILLASDSVNPRIALELAILRHAGAARQSAKGSRVETNKKENSNAEPVKETESVKSNEAPKSKTEKVASKTTEDKTASAEPEKTPSKAKHGEKLTDTQLAEIWPKVLEQLKGKHNTLYGILRMADAETTDDGISLAFQFPFHQKRASEGKHSSIISGILAEVSGRDDLVISFKKRVAKEPKPDTEEVKSIDEKPSPKPAQPAKEPESAVDQDPGALDSVLSVFGGGEVMK